MTTTEALQAHRLVTAQMRVIRYEGSPAWAVVPVQHGTAKCPSFDQLIDALAWAQEDR